MSTSPVLLSICSNILLVKTEKVFTGMERWKAGLAIIRFVSISIQVCVVQVTIRTYMPFFSYAIRECLQMPSLFFQKNFSIKLLPTTPSFLALYILSVFGNRSFARGIRVRYCGMNYDYHHYLSWKELFERLQYSWHWVYMETKPLGSFHVGMIYFSSLCKWFSRVIKGFTHASAETRLMCLKFLG